jgi:predicted O-linked N-acetylglucosamine transferase (SPINDLY family)
MSSLGPILKRARQKKIRIGYFSADFHNHATAYLMAELFERHDKGKFELIAFSFGPQTNDVMQLRVSQAFDQFIDVASMSNLEVAQFSRELEIDIAIDLKGLTQDSRLGIFSFKAAPIQVSYLGYPGTLGVDYIDYLIADKTLIPKTSIHHFSEKIVYLPNSYQVNDRHRLIASTHFTKQELGLPKDAFIFCCFNNNYKITPDVFDSWVRILKAVDSSVLWLLQDNSTASMNLQKEAANRGLDPTRLVFAERMALPEHLARHKAADLFLDTLPYNAHTTASDALWAGLPVLTCIGESFASRVAASLLNAIGLPELITETRVDYEALAIELATNPSKLKEIKEKLAQNRLTTPLFDTVLFTKHIEAAYTLMYERYQADLTPESIEVF